MPRKHPHAGVCAPGNALQNDCEAKCFFQKYDSINHNWLDFSAYRCTYASSLYPFYFTLQAATINKKSISFRLNNDGTENDLYVIEVNNKEGKKIKPVEVTVNRQSSQVITIPLKLKNSGNEISVSVSRKSNHSQSRTIDFNKPVSILSTSSNR